MTAVNPAPPAKQPIEVPGSLDSSKIERILIVRLSALGDILHAVPAQQQLARFFPSARIDWLCESHYRPLLESISGITKVWSLNTRAWRRNPLSSRDLLHLVRDLRRCRYDLALDFQGLLKSALLARLARPRSILGFRPERFKERGIDWFYDLAIPGEADLDRHIIDTNLDLVRRLIPDCDGGARFAIEIPAQDEELIDRELRALDGQKPVLINPGAGWSTKLWPAEDYGRLGTLIEHRLQLPVVYAYGPGEEALLERIRRVWEPRRVRAFPTTILQLAALISRSALLVAGDSGPLHLAVASGIPTVAVLGPTAPRRNGPYAGDDEIVRRRLHCSNSYRRTCDEFICMEIPVETVFEAVVRRLTSIDQIVPLEVTPD